MFKLQSEVLAKLAAGIGQISDQATRLWAQNLVRAIVQILCNSKQPLEHDGNVTITGSLLVGPQKLAVQTGAETGFQDAQVYVVRTPNASPTLVPSPYDAAIQVQQWTGSTELSTGDTVTLINSAAVSTTGVGQAAHLNMACYRAALGKFELIAVGAQV